ncbi:DUF3347 domain-containing protein [Aquimarina sp. MAR_2010_214]|uniref:DUF3347 domain-containing protein n=1 Tax=Aquimarina sp. MAR_2010_214 TaxID=1250026 RepID=UPI00130460C7|nr:DUF3347 domain-containing protein [Aquimarina sp. MAR_2010_214]
MVFIFTALLGVSCNKDKKPESVAVDENINEIVDYNKTDLISKVKFSDIKTQEIYDLYLSVKAALVNSESGIVQAETKKLEAVIEDSEENKQIKAVSKLISLTKDIKKQRDFFVSLTSEVEKLVGKAKITSGEVYKQFCPMAFDGEGGYWLSDSKEVRNPYYGKKMLACGSVEKTFK